MFSTRKRHIIRRDLENEEERERPPIVSPRKRPLVLDDSDDKSDANAQLESSCKKLRWVILDEDDEDEAASSSAKERPEDHDKYHGALLNSLKASQAASSGNVPHLPAETLLNILEYVDAADILDYRLVCRSFKYAIDTHIMYYHIQNAELIGFLGRKQDQLFEHVHAKDYWDFAFGRAKFGALDEQEDGQAKWDPKGATFNLIDDWSKAFDRIGGDFSSDNVWWDHTRRCLDLTNNPLSYGQLRWCIKTANTVLDFGIEDEEQVDIEFVVDEEFDNDDPGSRITLRITDWKVMLKNFFREERAFKLNMRATIDDDYTYSHQEDCLRDMRRRKFRSRLNAKDQNDSRLIWKMDNMVPLYGRHTYVNVNVDYDDVERSERTAVETLMLLRKEAAMSCHEREALNLIVSERSTMLKEIEAIDTMFKRWQENLLSLQYFSLERIALGQDDLDPNPVTWSQSVIDRERRNLAEWKGQRDVMKQLAALLDATNTASALVNDGFISESESEF